MEAQKVTDPAKIVTDPVLLAHLERQGIDKDYVEFTTDYGKSIKGTSSPYAKFYRDLKTDMQFMVLTQLPMVDYDGKAIEAGWQKTDKGFAEKNNLFKADVTGLQVTITVRNDQPDGRKAGQQVVFRPQLFLNGIEQEPSEAALLDVDPLNENYTNNTLEWDYGICKRRLRIIEGRLLGSWIFDKNPAGEVRIRYNQSGDFKLRLGQFGTDEDTEVVAVEVFNNPLEYGFTKGYPLTISDSATFYPDAHPESTSVDGWVRRWASETWSSIRSGAGNVSYDSDTDISLAEILCDTASSKWLSLGRGIFLFDTSSLPDTATIAAATLSLCSWSKTDVASITPDINIYSVNPASNTSLTPGDYGTFGSTAYSTAITYAAWQILAAYNDFALNSTGIAAISLTGVSKFGVRNANYDVSGTTPSWVSGAESYFHCFAAERGSGYKPKLVITYYTNEQKTSSDSGSGVETIALRQLGIVEAGVGVEASLTATMMLASDGGSGSEIGGILKSLSSQDEGSGTDGVRILTGKTGYDIKLHPHRGQVSITHKEVNL
jgi:hypothetical protein